MAQVNKQNGYLDCWSEDDTSAFFQLVDKASCELNLIWLEASLFLKYLWLGVVRVYHHSSVIAFFAI